MRPIELHDKLHNITNRESLYRNGYIDENLKLFSHVIIDEQEIMKFSYAGISAEKDGIPFLVRKHSRFRDYPFHIHDWIEISYMYSGNCTQIINSKEYKMEEGQFLLMAPGTIHTIKPLSENDIIVQIALGQKYLTQNFFNRLSSNSIVTSFFIDAFSSTNKIDSFFLFQSQTSERLRIFIEEFLCEWYEPSLASIDTQNNLFSLIISELVNIINKTDTPSSHLYKNQYILPALQYIEKNYKTVTLKEAASHFGLNPNYLSNILKKHTGLSFNELVQSEKLSACERLLTSSSMSVIEIANFVGYQNISFFYRIFKNKYGCMPGEYRDRKF